MLSRSNGQKKESTVKTPSHICDACLYRAQSRKSLRAHCTRDCPKYLPPLHRAQKRNSKDQKVENTNKDAMQEKTSAAATACTVRKTRNSKWQVSLPEESVEFVPENIKKADKQKNTIPRIGDIADKPYKGPVFLGWLQDAMASLSLSTDVFPDFCENIEDIQLQSFDPSLPKIEDVDAVEAQFYEHKH